MNRCDSGFNLILGGLRRARRKLQQAQPFVDQGRVPSRPILLEQGLELAGGIEPRRQARRMERHQRSERACFRCGRGRMLEQKARQSDRFATQLDLHRRFRRRAVISLVEQQIQRAMDGRQPLRKIGVRKSNSRFELASTFLAREMRFWVAASVSRNAAAISLTPV